MFYGTKTKITEKGSKLYLWEPNETTGLSKSDLKKLRETKVKSAKTVNKNDV